jgi:hypothetical protein
VPPLVDPADGEAFVSEDKVRFRAGNTPKTVYVTYEASTRPVSATRVRHDPDPAAQRRGQLRAEAARSHRAR